MKLAGTILVSAAIATASLALATPASAIIFKLTNTSGADGYVQKLGTGFELFGADNYCAGKFDCSTLYTTKATKAGFYSFDFGYYSFDSTGFGVADPAGYILDGVETQLSNDLLARYAGTITIAYKAGDTFGFYINTDGIGGRGTLAISPIPPGVPEPASWATMIAGFGLVGGALRRRAPAALPA